MFSVRQDMMSTGDNNFMLEHRFLQTPTLLLVQPL